MRTIFLLPKLLIVFLLSCSDSDCEDDVAIADVNKLYGEWTLEKSEINGQLVNSHDQMEFTTDASTQFTHLDEVHQSHPVADNGTYYIVENTLIVNWANNIDGHSVTKYQILELTETKLRWKIVVPHSGNHIETFSKWLFFLLLLTRAFRANCRSKFSSLAAFIHFVFYQACFQTSVKEFDFARRS